MLQTDVELLRIAATHTSTICVMRYAPRSGWSVHAAAVGIIARRGQKTIEGLPRPDTIVLFRFKAVAMLSTYLQGAA